MRLRDTLQILGGSILVYTAVATCAGGGAGTAGRDAGGVPSRSDGSKILDGLTDPVPAALADGNQSGTRLKAKYYVGSDGSKEFIGWHDSQRDEDCGFTTASDGNLRCLPSTAALVLSYFADASCTQPLVLVTVGAGCTTPKTTFGPLPTTISCPMAGHSVYQVGSSFTGTVYSGTTSACTKSTVPSTYAVYSLGAEVPASSFVAATVQTDQ